MIACVEVAVVSFGIVRHVPEPRFTYWPASLRSHCCEGKAG